MRIPRSLSLFIAATALLTGGVALAQANFSPPYAFLEAIRKGDGAKVNDILQNPNVNVVNTRDSKTGETALHILTQKRNAEWLGVILSRGGNPNLGDNEGNTPLHIAAQMNFTDGAMVLIQWQARVDARNNAGETPLIRAVRLRHVDMVKLLMRSGANPDLTDNETGRSARDYATEDPRGRALLTIIEAGGKDSTAPKPQPAMDFGGDFTPIP